MPKNEEYWIKREKKWIEQNIKNDRAYARQLEKRCQELIKQLELEINQNYMKYADATGLSMQEVLKKVSKTDIASFERIAKRMVKDKDFSKYANARLKLYNATMRINRLEYLKAKIGVELIGFHLKEEAVLKQWLAQSYVDEMERQAGILGLNKSTSMLSKLKAVLNASFNGATWSARLWIGQDELKARLDAIISRAMVQGTNPTTLARELMKNVREEIKNKRYAIERLLRTETARVQTDAQIDSFKRNGYTKVMFIAEPSACENCADIASANNGIYSLEKAPKPPIHPCCRCSLAAYA